MLHGQHYDAKPACRNRGDWRIVGFRLGLARGYLNNDSLTREQFISNPFQSPEDKREGSHAVLFKTGDLFKCLSSSRMESTGRQDHQIKIRGYRVELDEIGSVIRTFPGVTQSVVVATNLEQSEQTMLIGYFVIKNGQIMDQDSEEVVLNHLRTVLPEYMIPSRLVQLEEMPLNFNGKIDRNGLPPPPPLKVMSRSSTDDPKKESIDPILNSLIKIWKEILNLEATEEYEMDADFFETGGNSLLAMRLVERVNAEIGVAVDAAHVFKFSTITEFRENLSV